MIPAFKPLAGFSPNCCAVFVQIEHCAEELLTKPKEEKIMIDNISTHFFILKNSIQR